MTGNAEIGLSESEARLETPVKLGLIGMGSIGRIHYESLTDFPQKNFDIKAVADINPTGRSKKLTGEVADFYTSHKELLADPDILAVSINTPPDSHFQLVMEALEADKHVLVEKPPALTVLDCKKMIDLANDKRKVLFMAFHARYNPAVDLAKKELEGKNVKSIHVDDAGYVLNYHDDDSWIFDPEVAGGGALMDSGINALSIITHVLPNIEMDPISAKFDQPEDFRVETKGNIDFKFGKNGIGHIDMDWLRKGPDKRQITFGTEEGDKYLVDIVSTRLLKNGKLLHGTEELRELVDEHSEYRGIYDNFATCISKGSSLVSTKEMEFIEKAYRLGNK